MKLRIYLILCACWAAFSLQAQEDSLRATRYVMRSVLYGAGMSNVLDTYLSPLEYKGPEIRILRENMRMTRLMNGNVSAQNLLQANVSYTHNPSQTANMYAGLVNWTYALHYQFRLNEQLKLLAGPMIDLNGGFVYNTRNSNNPAQAKAYGSVGISGMAIYKFRIGNYPLVVRYQVNLPLLGAMFSPEFGQSYYEMFSLGHKGKNVLFTSLHNNPSLRQMLTLDFPIRKVTMRVGYICDLQQAKVNHLKYHTYSHDFMIGIVKNFYLREDIQGNSPEANFESLWKIIDEQYCFLDYKHETYGLDWDEVHTRYAKRISSSMSWESLFEVLSEMVNELRDGHVNLSSSLGTSQYREWFDAYPRNFSDSIQSNYLKKDYIITSGLTYQILENNIGYIYCESFSDGIGDGNLDQMLKKLEICDGLIIDVRNNGGGNLTTAQKLAARFTNDYSTKTGRTVYK